MSLTKTKTDTVLQTNKKLWLLLIVLFIVIGVSYWTIGSQKWSGRAIGGLNDAGYQAVFLTNGQVYFGQLGSGFGGFMKLDDVYYLRVQRALQPAQTEDGVASQEQTGISLVKLGSELHGPEDSMLINRDQILFVEAMKTDSKVVQAIKKEKESQTE